MVKETKKTVTRFVKEEVVIDKKRICNVCGKEIVEGYWSIDEYQFAATTIEDICSRKCLEKRVWDYMEVSEGECSYHTFGIQYHRKPF